MDGSLTFDVLVLSGKSQWTSISRWPSATAAQNEARLLVAGKKHLGVKVSQETYDHDENRFKEKTLFKHMKSDKKAATGSAGGSVADSMDGSMSTEPDDYDEFDEFDDFDDYDDGPDWVIPVFGLFTALAVILGLGIFFFDGKIDVTNNTKSDYFLFALPAAVTNVSSGGENVSVRIDLQLELDGAQDAQAVELALAQIMESVLVEIQETDAGDLRKSAKIQLLRGQLKQKIQDAMGDTNLNGVLFNNIQVF